jgi:hypothetical protein
MNLNNNVSDLVNNVHSRTNPPTLNNFNMINSMMDSMNGNGLFHIQHYNDISSGVFPSPNFNNNGNNINGQGDKNKNQNNNNNNKGKNSNNISTFTNLKPSTGNHKNGPVTSKNYSLPFK